jgi:hypothetical protein
MQTQDMEKLVAAMTANTEYRFGELVDLARAQELFPKLVSEQGELERWQSTKLGLIFKKFVGPNFQRSQTRQRPATSGYLGRQTDRPETIAAARHW